MDLSALPADKRQLLQQLVTTLAQVPGMAAVVLGGSYASGAQHSASDLDIGLYYRPAQPFAIAAVRDVAMQIATPDSSPTVTDFYEWGAWVNGGAWIQTAAGKVDFLYRNLDQVQKAIDDAHAGIVQHDYDQQPTFGYYSTGYLAETQICLPLYDPDGEITRLKTQVQGYPPALKRSVVRDSLWSAEFTMLFARNYAAAGDVYNTTGCLVRAAGAMTQALFALNEEYFLTDKRVMKTIGAFAVLPPDYINQVTGILAHPGNDAEELSAAVQRLEAAWRGIVELDGSYTPKFVL